MACGDVLSLEDLQTAKKHQIFEAEVITGRAGGATGGAPIEYATNPVTGQTQKTLPAVLRDAGFEQASFTFTTGGTLGVNDRNKAVFDPVSKAWYVWKGALPKIVTAGSNPVGDANWSPWTDPTMRTDFDAFVASLASSTGYQLVGGLAEHYGWPSNIIVVDRPPYNGDFVAAYSAVPSTGNCVLVCGKRGYNILSLPDNTKPNVWVVGSGVPAWDRTGKKLISGSGTVLQGSIYNSAKGFGLFNLGIDRGETVRTTLADGAYRDAFVNINFGNDANIRYGDLIILESETVTGVPQSNTHCILNENGQGVVQTGVVEVIDGYHGHVIKVRNFTGDTTIARYQAGTAGIFKSDAGAKALSASFARFLIDGDSSRQSAGFLYEAQSQTADGLKFGSLAGVNTRWLIAEAAASTNSITGISIGAASCEVASGVNADSAIYIGPRTIGVSIGSHQLNACAKGGIIVRSGATLVDIGSGYSKGSSSADGYRFESACSHGKLVSVDNTGWGVYNNGNTLLDAAEITCVNNTLGGISVVTTVPTTLNNSWTNPLGDFRAAKYGSLIRISGQLSAGGLGSGYTYVTVATLSTCRPSIEEYISCVGFDGSGAPKPLAAKVKTTGEIVVYGLQPQAINIIHLSGSFVVQGNQ